MSDFRARYPAVKSRRNHPRSAGRGHHRRSWRDVRLPRPRTYGGAHRDGPRPVHPGSAAGGRVGRYKTRCSSLPVLYPRLRSPPRATEVPLVARPVARRRSLQAIVQRSRGHLWAMVHDRQWADSGGRPHSRAASCTVYSSGSSMASGRPPVDAPASDSPGRQHAARGGRLVAAAAVDADRAVRRFATPITLLKDNDSRKPRHQPLRHLGLEVAHSASGRHRLAPGTAYMGGGRSDR